MTITPKETAVLRLDLAHRGWGTHVISHFEDDDDYSNLNIRISKTFRDLPTSNIETTSPYNKIGETFIILNEYVKIFENNPTFIPNIELTPTKKISPVREPSDFEIDFNNLNDEYQLADLMRQKGWRYSDREMVHGTNLVKYRRI